MSFTKSTIQEIFRTLGLKQDGVNHGVYNGTWEGSGQEIISVSPIDETVLGRVVVVRLISILITLQFPCSNFITCIFQNRPPSKISTKHWSKLQKQKRFGIKYVFMEY